jgi:hypothetical protein
MVATMVTIFAVRTKFLVGANDRTAVDGGASRRIAFVLLREDGDHRSLVPMADGMERATS